MLSNHQQFSFMRKYYSYSAFLSLLLSGILYACAPSTQITASWHDPDTDAEYNNLLVAALTHNLEAKSTVEGELVVALQNEEVGVTNSGKLFAPNFTKDIAEDKEKLLAKIRENGNDAILTIALLDQKTETRYVPGSATYAPTVSFGFYGGFYNYYNYRYPAVYDPGYYTQDKTYFLETNLYDAETEKLLWSAQSRTYNPIDIDSFSEEFAGIIVARLKKEGLI